MDGALRAMVLWIVVGEELILLERKRTVPALRFLDSSLHKVEIPFGVC